VWTTLLVPDYSVLGAAAQRVLLAKPCRLGHRRTLRTDGRKAGCRRCRYLHELRRQTAAWELRRYWELWEAEHQAEWRTAAAVALDRYWQARADAARALEIYWEHRRED
jgi:hypothetical protein